MAKEVTLGKAKVSVVAETEKHNRDIDKAKSKVKSLGNETEKMSTRAKAAWALVGASVVGVSYELNKMINVASNLEEATSKFNTVFASQMSLANDWAKELNKSYGQSTREARENLAAIQDLLVPMGLAQDAAGKLSFEVVKLATDLGSFNNKLTSQVIDDYQSALVGNYETMKKYGVVLNATVVSQQALKMGLADSKNELTASNKAMAAHELIVQGSTAAIGDFIRTSDGFANTTKDLESSWEDFSATLGNEFLPVATKVKRALADILKEMTEMQKQGRLSKYADALLLSMTGPMAAIVKYNTEALKLILGTNKDAEDALKKTFKVKPFEAATKSVKEFTDAEIKAQEALNNLADSFTDDDLFEREIKSGYATQADIQEFEDSIEEIIDWGEDKFEDFFTGITENFTSAVQSEMAGIFTDLLTDDLDSFEDYFKNFTQSLTNMWGQMAAKMVMQQAMFSLTGGASGAAMTGAGGLGMLGAGAVLAGVGSYLNRRSEAEQREQQREQLRERISSQVSGSIAQLELSDLDYEIFQMNETMKNLVDSARKARMPIDDIIKLRRLETQAIIEQAQSGFVNLQGNISDFITGKQRQDWGVSDWQREFGNLSDELMNLDKTADDYNDKSLELLTDQFNILQNIYQIQENQLRALESTSQSLVAQAVGLQTSEGLPISREFFESRYGELLSSALRPDPNTGMLNTTDIAFFQGFVNDYIDAMSLVGDDYQDLINRTSSDLLTINDAVQSEMGMLSDALNMNTEAVGGNTEAILNQLEALTGTISNIADVTTLETWLGARTPEMSQSLLNDFQAYAEWASQTDNNVLPGSHYTDIHDVAVGIDDYAQQLLAWVQDATVATRETTAWQTLNEWAEELALVTSSASAGSSYDYGAYGERLDLIQTALNLFNYMPDLPSSEQIVNNNVPDQQYNFQVLDLPDDYNPWGNNSGLRPTKSGPTQVNLVVSGKKLAEVMIDQSRENPEFKRMLQ